MVLAKPAVVSGVFAASQVLMLAADEAVTGKVGASATMSAGVPAGRLVAGLNVVGPASWVPDQLAGRTPCWGL